jgi:hypothetical protein
MRSSLSEVLLTTLSSTRLAFDSIAPILEPIFYREIKLNIKKALTFSSCYISLLLTPIYAAEAWCYRMFYCATMGLSPNLLSDLTSAGKAPPALSCIDMNCFYY